ncbi:tryptophan 2,3-dioxygenase [Pseudodonghicola flavimaris]|uniref:Tryptophan 2,3-dioxygenase n=1 Tax=Pseudodonghicola flavimaris TaxID=3050036 RepID=A0ABT7EZ23_9RHOB|nr:tryptophan 2,3-dioxygenase family protein [Pseudodonghicola flavimaris]MDK3017597.1 tryptophan 2,3-dioxygenase family protein [Pseudodonghicola flavimaris]
MPDYKPVFPDLIDAAQVVASTAPRPIGKTDAAQRAETAASTGGDPLLEFAGRTNPYIDYQSIDLLLSLQHPRSDGYDEMCFFVMGQVKELLFRGLHFELYNAREQLRQGEIVNAIEILSRASAFTDYITGSWDVLQTISAEGFNQFRDHLSTASGQLSFMYRHVEFVLGNKSRRLASAHKNLPHIWPAMEAALTSPSLYDAAIAQLHAAGHPVDARALDRDWSETYSPNASVAAAWRQVYDDPRPENPLYRLAETLIALDEKMSLYRWRHYTSVHKIIGYKPGTGGSAGVGWLRQVTEHRFFPELWEIRTGF